QNWIISDYWVLYGGAIICLVIALHPKRTLYALFGFVMFAGMMLQDAYEYTSWFYPPHVNVYVADRYMSQTIYDYTTQITEKISARYDSLSYQAFRMFYNRGGDVHRRLFNSVASVYLWTNDRVLVPGQSAERMVEEFNEANEIVVLSTASQTQPLLDMLFSLIDVTELERHLFPHPLGDIELIFFRINKDN
nr:hypothetical protein [Anaerolineae bacterium]